MPFFLTYSLSLSLFLSVPASFLLLIALSCSTACLFVESGLTTLNLSLGLIVFLSDTEYPAPWTQCEGLFSFSTPQRGAGCSFFPRVFFSTKMRCSAAVRQTKSNSKTEKSTMTIWRTAFAAVLPLAVAFSTHIGAFLLYFFFFFFFFFPVSSGHERGARLKLCSLQQGQFSRGLSLELGFVAIRLTAVQKASILR